MRYRNKFLFVLILLLWEIQPTWATERPVFGIAIDDESRSVPKNSIRVLLYNFNSKRAEEVNYFSHKIDKESYTLRDEDKNGSNPIVGFILNEETPTIVVDHSFDIGQYIILSKFNILKLDSSIDYSIPLHRQNKTGMQPIRTFDYGKFSIFMRDQPLQSFQGLKDQINSFDRSHEKFNPNFRFVNMTSMTTKTAGHLREALGSKEDSLNLSKDKDKEEDPFSLHKEDLGENVTILSLLSFGCINIYRTNRAIRGHDLVVCSGNDPQRDELVMVDSEWTCETSASKTRINAKINSDLVCDRMIQLKKRIEERAYSSQIDQEELNLFNLFKSFFNTPHARIYKLLYKIYDRPIDNKRGIAKPWIKLMEEDEKIKIAEKAGILQLPMEGLLIAPQIKHNPTDGGSLQLFMEFLNKQQGVTLVPSLWELLREKYPNHYNTFFDLK